MSRKRGCLVPPHGAEVHAKAARVARRAIGVAKTRERLLGDGFSEANIARIHSPIGLPILAETPEEIAISIAGEMIEHRARLAGRRH